ncbi:MAG: hypothetical protein JST80_00910 [Bdellovibrionales bacterium]|nr:hypothetical protein [Bdellovibrionales bacterium]
MGDFQQQFSAYLREVESFVETMHAGLSRLSEDEVSNKIVGTPKFTGPQKVLVVDGAEINRVLFTRYFQGLPFEIAFARSEDEAENKIAQQRYDLVLRDWKHVLSQGLSKQAVIESVLRQLAN